MRTGETFTTHNQTMTVGRHLGGGSEGEVYEVIEPEGGLQLALKWYHDSQATPARRAALQELISRGQPSDRFLWPLELIETSDGRRFGYVMPLRPPGFVGIAALLSGKVVRDERAVVRFAFELAQAFRDLHIAGLCYRDINFGNAFLHPETGAALVCDNDNVGIDGVGYSSVRGTPKFWAPEVARNEVSPSKYTDRYSLAVLLFYLLVVHHPLEGVRTEQGLADEAANQRHFVDDPLFCFDAGSAANRPDPGAHAHVTALWNALPTRIRHLFQRAFTIGLTSPERRVVDTEWCHALAEMRSGLHLCSSCSRATFLDQGFTIRPCAACSTLDQVFALEVNEHAIAVSHGALLADHHFRNNLDFDTIHGEVEQHPERADLCGLRIDVAHADYQVGTGSVRIVRFGERAGLIEGAQVRFAEATASVRRTRTLPPAGTTSF